MSVLLMFLVLSFLFCFVLFFVILTQGLFADLRGGEWRERQRETSIGCLLYAPLPGFEPTTFWCTGWCSNQLSNWARTIVTYDLTKKKHDLLMREQVYHGHGMTYSWHLETYSGLLLDFYHCSVIPALGRVWKTFEENHCAYKHVYSSAMVAGLLLTC